MVGPDKGRHLGIWLEICDAMPRMTLLVLTGQGEAYIIKLQYALTSKHNKFVVRSM